MKWIIIHESHLLFDLQMFINTFDFTWLDRVTVTGLIHPSIPLNFKHWVELKETLIGLSPRSLSDSKEKMGVKVNTSDGEES